VHAPPPERTVKRYKMWKGKTNWEIRVDSEGQDLGRLGTQKEPGNQDLNAPYLKGEGDERETL